MNETEQNMKRTAEFPLPSSAAARKAPKSKNPQKMDAEIHNLPSKDFVVTREILKNNVCRICATYYESGPMLVPLYLHHDSFRLSKVINTFLPIKVRKDDGLPEYACRSCTDILLAWREIRDNCREAAKILNSQADSLGELAEGTHTISRNNDRSQLIETVQSVLATYLLHDSSMELVCQECELRTTSEDFVQHLESKHGHVKDRDAVEAFVKDHVTFEEMLMSDSDTDVISIVSTASTEQSAVVPLRLDRPMCPESASFSCSVSSDKNELVRHLSEEQTNFNRLRCKLCDHVADDAAKLTTHVTESHTIPICNIDNDQPTQIPDETNQKRIPAVCPDCNRTFSNKYNMLNHMKTHTNAESSKFDCECGKSYSTRGNLVAHRRIAHAGELPHSCAECGERFRSRSARDIHVRLHSGERPFPCRHCALSFRAKNSRDKHQETHAPRRHVCELCGDKFRREAHLKYHVGTHRRRPN